MSSKGISQLSQYVGKLNGLLAVNKPSGVFATELVKQMQDDIYSKLGEDPVVKGSPGYIKMFCDYKMGTNMMGVLPIAFGNNILSFKLHRRSIMNSKSCVVTGELGVMSKTWFREEERKPYEHITRESLEKELQQLIGETTQKVVRKGTVMFNGKSFKDIVKEGLSLPDHAFYMANCEVRKIVCTEFNPPTFKFEIDCDRTLNIATLVNDLGYNLSTCADVKQIFFTKYGPFTLEDAVVPYSYTTDELLGLLQKYKHCFQNSRESKI